jgi:hypothetical protein
MNTSSSAHTSVTTEPGSLLAYHAIVAIQAPTQPAETPEH